jgi:hypothetical protein
MTIGHFEMTLSHCQLLDKIKLEPMMNYERISQPQSGQ